MRRGVHSVTGGFRVYNDRRRLTAIVDVCMKPGVIPWDTTDGEMDALWHVVVTPERAWAWREVYAPPAAEFAMAPLLAPHFTRFNVDTSRMTYLQFEIAVGAWLRELPDAWNPITAPSDLYRALTGAR